MAIHAKFPGIFPRTDDFARFEFSDGQVGYLDPRYILQIVQNPKEVFRNPPYHLNPSADLLYDGAVVLALIVFLFLLRVILSGAYKSRLSPRSGLFTYIARNVVSLRPKKEKRFLEALWFSCWHTVSTIVALCLLYTELGTEQEPQWLRYHLQHPRGRWYWITTASEFAHGSSGWPMIHNSNFMRIFYYFEAAFWISSALFLYVETYRKDTLILAFHHFMTIFLIVISYVYNYTRIGVMIILLHDIVDVFLYSTKIIHYTNAGMIYSSIGFVLFAVSYFVTRIIIFPIYCVWPSVFLTDITTIIEDAHLFHWRIPGGAVLPGFLIMLYFLHLYWFYLVVDMFVRLALDLVFTSQLQHTEDLRSVNSDEDYRESEEFEDLKKE